MSEAIGLSIPRACEVSGLGRTSLYAAVKSGDLPARKVGRRTIILPDDLDSYLKSLPTVAVDVDAVQCRAAKHNRRHPKKAKA
jgi:excisionase family DNA binding protein